MEAPGEQVFWQLGVPDLAGETQQQQISDVCDRLDQLSRLTAHLEEKFESMVGSLHARISLIEQPLSNLSAISRRLRSIEIVQDMCGDVSGPPPFDTSQKVDDTQPNSLFILGLPEHKANFTERVQLICSEFYSTVVQEVNELRIDFDTYSKRKTHDDDTCLACGGRGCGLCHGEAKCLACAGRGCSLCRSKSEEVDVTKEPEEDTSSRDRSPWLPSVLLPVIHKAVRGSDRAKSPRR